MSGFLYFYFHFFVCTFCVKCWLQRLQHDSTRCLKEKSHLKIFKVGVDFFSSFFLSLSILIDILFSQTCTNLPSGSLRVHSKRINCEFAFLLLYTTGKRCLSQTRNGPPDNKSKTNDKPSTPLIRTVAIFPHSTCTTTSYFSCPSSSILDPRPPFDLDALIGNRSDFRTRLQNEKTSVERAMTSSTKWRQGCDFCQVDCRGRRVKPRSALQRHDGCRKTTARQPSGTFGARVGFSGRGRGHNERFCSPNTVFPGAMRWF